MLMLAASIGSWNTDSSRGEVMVVVSSSKYGLQASSLFNFELQGPSMASQASKLQQWRPVLARFSTVEHRSSVVWTPLSFPVHCVTVS
ncbi:hypothetical protein E3N88_38810 [Mikania micrantha]|uniref:Uncharacterized protein n=1 Tax=Mikania micrantha TaxID=192012 RepID=A0A5N6LV10_9ASTR|nr:hypothetical protein E3N88_38810 [Mikania micrantha]